MSKRITNDYSTLNSNYLHANPIWHVVDYPWKITQVIKLIERNKLQPKLIVEYVEDYIDIVRITPVYGVKDFYKFSLTALTK